MFTPAQGTDPVNNPVMDPRFQLLPKDLAHDEAVLSSFETNVQALLTERDQVIAILVALEDELNFLDEWLGEIGVRNDARICQELTHLNVSEGELQARPVFGHQSTGGEAAGNRGP